MASLINSHFSFNGSRKDSLEYQQSLSSVSSESVASICEQADVDPLLTYHLSLLKVEAAQQEVHEATATPIFTMPVLKHFESDSQPLFPQYGLLAGLSDVLYGKTANQKTVSMSLNKDPRIFLNVAAPSSTFICGSQGSGKSHTLSCLLESCLMSSDAGELPRPLTGLVFHYDAFICDYGGSPCEAAYLSSNPKIKVRVLCSPTNLQTIQRTYHGLNVDIGILQINQADLNTKRMLDLMAVGQDGGQMPLYMHTVKRILREMRILQQQFGSAFNYNDFKRQVLDSPLTPAQVEPLKQRLDILESFMPREQVGISKKRKTDSVRKRRQWESVPGRLTIVDLSCPCISPETACSLFNICLSIFLEQDTNTGRIVALDEAHKFMNASAEAAAFTDTLLSTVRLQRHLGTRIVLSTQEPTISPALLDLCSVTIVHRFTSPEWLRSLRRHLAAAADDVHLQRAGLKGGEGSSKNDDDDNIQENDASAIFANIVGMKVGEALLFAPSAMIGLTTQGDGEVSVRRLGAAYLKIKVRERLTVDGGKSIMAS